MATNPDGGKFWKGKVPPSSKTEFVPKVKPFRGNKKEIMEKIKMRRMVPDKKKSYA